MGNALTSKFTQKKISKNSYAMSACNSVMMKFYSEQAKETVTISITVKGEDREYLEKLYWAAAPELIGKLPNRWTTMRRRDAFKTEISHVEVIYDPALVIPESERNKTLGFEDIRAQFTEKWNLAPEWTGETIQLKNEFNELKTFISGLCGKGQLKTLLTYPELAEYVDTQPIRELFDYDLKRFVLEGGLKLLPKRKDEKNLPDAIRPALEKLNILKLGDL